MKLLRVVGARPQFMQAAVFREALDGTDHTEILVHTGQHYDERMSQVFFDELGIPQPDYNLDVGSSTHGVQTGQMLSKLDDLLLQVKPDAVVVDGDTNSTLAGALAGAKLHIPVVHVEAGLRSFNRKMPEEINRIVTDHVAEILCAPTSTAMNNLANEGLGDRATITGDLMYDCFLKYSTFSKSDILNNLGLKSERFILSTIHRAENVDNTDVLRNFLQALNELEYEVILPLHPRTKSRLENENLLTESSAKNIRIIEPISYLDMLALEINAYAIVTDSGGVQREAYFAKKPCVILRDTSEWSEQIETGYSIISGVDNVDSILKAYTKVMKQDKAWCDLYGGGNASRNIIEEIESRLR